MKPSVPSTILYVLWAFLLGVSAQDHMAAFERLEDMGITEQKLKNMRKNLSGISNDELKHAVQLILESSPKDFVDVTEPPSIAALQDAYDKDDNKEMRYSLVEVNIDTALGCNISDDNKCNPPIHAFTDPEDKATKDTIPAIYYEAFGIMTAQSPALKERIRVLLEEKLSKRMNFFDYYAFFQWCKKNKKNKENNENKESSVVEHSEL